MVELLGRLPAEERKLRDLEVKRWDLTETVWWEKKHVAHEDEKVAMEARLEAKLARGEWQIAARERVIAAMDALSSSDNRISVCEDLIEAHALSEEMAERAAVAERAMFHMQNEMHAMQAWGPDHASRPPAAVFDMRGPGIKLKSIDIR